MKSALSIVKYPHELLEQRAIEVTDFGDKLKRLVGNMHFTMRRAGGLGLAAPQVGVLSRMFVIDTSFMGNSPEGFVNPEVLEAIGECEMNEGCLSLPGTFQKIRRASAIWVRYQQIDGSHVLERRLEGLIARCFLHELDHLDGKLLVDHTSAAVKRNIYNRHAQRKGLPLR